MSIDSERLKKMALLRYVRRPNLDVMRINNGLNNGLNHAWLDRANDSIIYVKRCVNPNIQRNFSFMEYK